VEVVEPRLCKFDEAQLRASGLPTGKLNGIQFALREQLCFNPEKFTWKRSA
jgi:hypothetical protein